MTTNIKTISIWGTGGHLSDWGLQRGRTGRGGGGMRDMYQSKTLSDQHAAHEIFL